MAGCVQEAALGCAKSASFTWLGQVGIHHPISWILLSLLSVHMGCVILQTGITKFLFFLLPLLQKDSILGERVERR